MINILVTLLALSLFSQGCSLFQKQAVLPLGHSLFPRITQLGLDNRRRDLIIADLDFLVKETDLQPFVSQMSKRPLILDFDISNCRLDQVSCYYPSHPKTIFLNQNIFKLSKLERLGALIHETYHLQNNAPHVVCPHPENKVNDCDKGPNGAYGREADFYLQVSRANGSNEAMFLYQSIIKRILP